MAHDVFISYSSKDKAVADAICAHIENKKLRCWIAPRDISPGADWGKSIIEAINGSSLMVLIFSGNSNESTQVVREVERAVSKGIPIIPFRIEEIMPNDSMEYFISTTHWLDALTTPLENHIEELVKIVNNVLNPPEYMETENLRDNYIVKKTKKSILKKFLNYSALIITGIFVFFVWVSIFTNTDSNISLKLSALVLSALYLVFIDIILFKNYLKINNKNINTIIFNRESQFKLLIFALMWVLIFTVIFTPYHYSKNGISFDYGNSWSLNENSEGTLASLSIIGLNSDNPLYINIYKKNGILKDEFNKVYSNYSNNSNIKNLSVSSDGYMIKYKKLDSVSNTSNTIIEEYWLEKNNTIYVIKYQVPKSDLEYYRSDLMIVLKSFSVN